MILLEENHGASEKTPNLKKKECWAGLRLPGDWWKNSTWRAVCLGEARGWDDGFV